MFVSGETVAIVTSAIGIVLTLGASMFAGFAWTIRRIDAVRSELAHVEQSLNSHFPARIDSVEEKLTARIDLLAYEVTEVKIAVARLEGPPRHLLVASH